MWHWGSVQIRNKLFLAELGLGWERRTLCWFPLQHKEIEVCMPRLPQEQRPPRAQITQEWCWEEQEVAGMSSCCLGEINFLSHPLQQCSWVMKCPNPGASSVCDRHINFPFSCPSINAPGSWWILGAGIPRCRAWHSWTQSGSQEIGPAPTLEPAFPWEIQLWGRHFSTAPLFKTYMCDESHYLRAMKSQNHKGWERPPRLFGPACARSPPCQPDQSTEYHIQPFLKNLGILNLPGQPLPMLTFPMPTFPNTWSTSWTANIPFCLVQSWEPL